MIPFLTFKYTVAAQSESEAFNAHYMLINEIVEVGSTPEVDAFNWWQYVLIIYVSISAILLFRYILNISKLVKSIRQNSKMEYGSYFIVLTQKNESAYSFLKYIFLDKNSYENGHVNQEIIEHEIAHLNQKHTYDLLFIELIRVLLWVNPLWAFYKKALQLNHEFSADRVVVNKTKNLAKYLQLLIVPSNTSMMDLSSPFNYLTIKKRITMITKNTTPKFPMLKKAVVLPVLVVAISIFSTKEMLAQDSSIAKEKKTVEMKLNENGATEFQLKEYEVLTKKYFTKEAKNVKMPTKIDFRKMEEIYLQMNNLQQEKQLIVFMPKIKEILSSEKVNSERDKVIEGLLALFTVDYSQYMMLIKK